MVFSDFRSKVLFRIIILTGLLTVAIYLFILGDKIVSAIIMLAMVFISLSELLSMPMSKIKMFENRLDKKAKLEAGKTGKEYL